MSPLDGPAAAGVPPIRATESDHGYWRALCHGSEAGFQPAAAALTALRAEFPNYDPQAVRGIPRRGFLQLMAASLALGVMGCRRWPEREVVPLGRRPEGQMPGVAEHYATLTTLSGVATGIVVRCIDGRPIKVEGNALHPFSGGAADRFAQAAVLSLYDPDRSRTPVQRVAAAGAGAPARVARSWEDFEAFARPLFDALRRQGGGGLAVLAVPTASPTVMRLKSELLRAYPAATWHSWEPLHRDNEIDGARLAFGRALRPQLHFDRAEVVACFGADPLGSHPAHQRHVRGWARQRRRVDRGEMNRLYAIESHVSLTGSVADHRLPVRPSRVGEILRAVAVRLGVVPDAPSELSESEVEFIGRLCADLHAHRGTAALAVGPAQPPHVHALAHTVNHRLGAHGATVTFTSEPRSDEPGCAASLAGLAEALDRGSVQTLLILGGNPMYDAPADLVQRLGARRNRVGMQATNTAETGGQVIRIHLSPYENETSAQCAWHLPMAHEFECWGDGCAWDGTYGVQQPLIRPLYDGRSTAELLALILGWGRASESPPQGVDLVRQTCREYLLPSVRGSGAAEPRGDGVALGDDFEAAWRRLLHDGALAGSAWPTVAPPTPSIPPWPEAGAERRSPVSASTSGGSPASARALEAVFVPDARVYDGRFANNGWLQELPDPLTKLTWDNAALISPTDADALRIRTGTLVTLERPTQSGNRLRLEIAAYVMPGVAAGTVVLSLGFGRTAAGRVGDGVGFNTYALRSTDAAWIAPATVLSRTRRRHPLAMTQEHHLIDAVGMWGREKRVGPQGGSGYVIREASLDAYRRDRNVFHRAAHGGTALPLFQPPHGFNKPHAWAMAIDLNACTGCSACVVACQAENNIPIVGPRQVANHREMHWLRIDRYFKGPPENPDVVHAPMACAHCEAAPCEQVCPVAATVHDSEGLNVMVYNRCIGTRYCSNNCPYKVRRFNYFDYHAADPRGRPQPWLGIPDRQQRESGDAIGRMRFNPDVTVRMRGVMEKCTYCSHRIQEARIRAKTEWAAGRREDDRVLDGEVVPACAAACPSEAIVFGDLNDAESRVAKLLAGHRAYAMLHELGLRPRSQYLAKVRNPAPAAPADAPGEA